MIARKIKGSLLKFPIFYPCHLPKSAFSWHRHSAYCRPSSFWISWSFPASWRAGYLPATVDVIFGNKQPTCDDRADFHTLEIIFGRNSRHPVWIIQGSVVGFLLCKFQPPIAGPRVLYSIYLKVKYALGPVLYRRQFWHRICLSWDSKIVIGFGISQVAFRDSQRFTK